MDSIPTLTIEHDAAFGITRYRVGEQRIVSVVSLRTRTGDPYHAVYPARGCGDRFYDDAGDAHARARYLVAQYFPVTVLAS